MFKRKIRTHVDLLSIPRLWGQKCHSCIDVDVILGNCTKLFVTKDQPPSTSNIPSGHKKRLGGIKGYNYITSWYLDGYPDRIALGQQYNIREKPFVILYQV